MADTDFYSLGATSTVQNGDQWLIARGGLFYRFTGQMTVDSFGMTTFAAGLSVGRANLGAAVAPGSISFEQPITRHYVGDGTGYFWALSKRASSVTTDLLVMADSGLLRPGTDNGQPLGAGNFRWSVIYAGTGSINTSDGREKQQIGAIPDAWLDAWGDVRWRRFRYNDAVAAKGDAARWHVGLVAQQVCDAFAARGLDARDIGLLCYDSWEPVSEVPAVEDEDGAIVVPPHSARPGGDRWGLRYDECQAMEAAYQRRRCERIEARLAALEAQHG